MKAYRKSFFILFFLIIIFSYTSALTDPNTTLSRNCGSNITYASDYYACGNDLVDRGNYEQAIAYFRTARSMDERFFEQYKGISYQIGWLLNRLGRYDEALAEFQKSEKEHPEYINNYAIYYNEGCLLAKLGRNEEAVQKFDQALVIQYYNDYALFNKGIVLSRMGRYTEAKVAFDKARKSRGSNVPLLGSYREAANTYLDAAGISHPANPPSPFFTSSPSSGVQPAPTYMGELSLDLQIRKASDLMEQYQFDEAVRAYDQALVNDPTNYHAMEGKGVALANLGRFEEAVTILDRAILYLDYKKDESTYVDAWYVKGWALANLGKYNEAIVAFNKALVIQPDKFNAHYNKAWVLAQQKQYTSAAAEYNRSLDWENQQRLNIRSHSILGPLGTYQDAADAIDKASITTAVAASSTPVANTLIYQTDFSADPHWETDRPRQYFWDYTKQAYHFRSDENLGYAEMPVAYNESSFRLEFDITIPHADPGTIARVGLSKYNKTYDSDNAIMGEFRSWRAGTYREIKDGDKTFQIVAIDAVKKTTNEEYDGACRVNREDNKANATYGEGRIYHVAIEYDRDKDTIAAQVTDNIHTQNYYVCSGMYTKLGSFKDMNRIILVVRQEPNAYIEGYIDNVKLFSIDNSVPVVIPIATAVAPQVVSQSEWVNMTVPSVTPAPTSSAPPLPEIPVMLILVVLFITGVAGTGLYIWKNRDRVTKQRVLSLKQKVTAQFRDLEFYAEYVSLYMEECDRLLGQEKVEEAEKILHTAEKMQVALKDYEDRARAWKNQGYDISVLLHVGSAENLAQEYAMFEKRVDSLREFKADITNTIRLHPSMETDPVISRRVDWIRKNLGDTTKVDTISGEIIELRRITSEHEREAAQAKNVQDEMDYITVRTAELTIFPQYVESLFSRIRKSVNARNFTEALDVLKQSKAEVDDLRKLEFEYRDWKNRGYITTWPDTIPDDTYEGIRIRFEQFRQKILDLENNISHFETVIKTYPKSVTKPEFAQKREDIIRALRDPGNAMIAPMIKDLEENIRRSISLTEEQESRVQFQTLKVSSSPDIRPSTLKKMDPIQRSLASADYGEAEKKLMDLAREVLDEFKGQIDLGLREGAVIALTCDSVKSAIESRNYGDAIVESEIGIANVNRVREIFHKARGIRKGVTDPKLISIYDNGDYAKFMNLAKEQKEEIDQREIARKKAQEILLLAEKIGKVPQSMRGRIQSSQISEIESVAKELEEFRKTARPHLELSLDHKQLEVNVWHRVQITIKNKGDAHAQNVNFTFSPEFETKWIRPKSVSAGETTIFEDIALYPNKKGEVPLEITLTFQDGNNNTYTDKSEFFINVVDSQTPPPYTPSHDGDHTPPPSPPPDPRFPLEIAKLYKNYVWLGRGGFAHVFRATKKDGKNVAVKVPISIDPATGRTFVAEIQNWTKMVHENIVKVYEYNIMPPYFEMEMCDGSLAKTQKPVSNEKAAWFMFSICEGLKYAHSLNVIHRDLKPQNILLKNGVPKISDWGLSRVMASQSTTVIAGSYTLYYAAPEQVNKRRQDARTDLWQLGVIFYELTTGRLPFKEETVTDTIIAIATKDPLPPGQINPEAAPLDSIVMRCLEKNPQKRYQSAQELQTDLGEFLKINYSNSLSESLITRDGHSAEFCADLLLVNLKMGNLVEAYKYASDLAVYVTGNHRETAEELAEQLRVRIEGGFSDVQEELIKKADIFAHQVKRQRK